MKISLIIERLRTRLAGTLWENQIGGAAELAAVEDSGRFPLPSLYVVLGNDSAKRLDKSGSFHQEITERINIIAVLPNGDRFGKTAQDYVEDVRTALFACLLNWVLDDRANEIEYVGAHMLNMDRSRYFHQFDFQMISNVDAEDGTDQSEDVRLGNFDHLFAEWNLPETKIDTQPNAQDELKEIYES